MFGYGSTIWRENTLSWKNSETTVVSFNETNENKDGKSTADFVNFPTKTMGYADGVNSNLARWAWASTILGCHNASKDDSYAQSFINHTNKFIEASRENVGLYDGSLDAAIRLNLFVNAYHYLLLNTNLDAESNTAILKYIWQTAEYLSYDVNYRPDHNHGASVARGQHKAVIYVPEFNKHEEWKEQLIYRWNELARNLMANMDYREGSTGYANTVLNIFNNAILLSEQYGFELGEDFKKYTRKLAAYVAMATFPNGKLVQLGDTGNVNPTSHIKAAADILDDDEILYMITNGEEGKYPGFDSMYVGGNNAIAIMRSGWGKNDLYAFINAASGDSRSHTHPDSLSLDVYAYGRPLIVDSGLKDYGESEISTWLRRSSEAHNTVTIDKRVQSSIAHGSI